MGGHGGDVVVGGPVHVPPLVSQHGAMVEHLVVMTMVAPVVLLPEPRHLALFAIHSSRVVEVSSSVYQFIIANNNTVRY